MLVKTLLKKCDTGFDLVIVADSTSGHTMEFSSVKDAQIVVGGERIISWEVGFNAARNERTIVLLITI